MAAGGCPSLIIHVADNHEQIIEEVRLKTREEVRDDSCEMNMEETGLKVRDDSCEMNMEEARLEAREEVLEEVRENSGQMSMEEVRKGVREYGKSITRVDDKQAALKTQLVLMREQDLHLLKQLIHIGDNIRKMTRSHERHSRGRHGMQKAAHELMTSAADLSVTLRRLKGRSGSVVSGGPGDFSTVPLVRRQSEPQVCTLAAGVNSWNSRRGSASSLDWWSEDTMGSSEDGLDTYDSDENNSTRDTAIPKTTATITVTPPSSTNETTTTTTTTTTNLTTTTTTTTDESDDDDEEDDLDLSPLKQDHFQRPKSHSVIASSFMGRSNLAGGNSTYSDILNQNVRLWKTRLEHACGVRRKVSILEEESHGSD